MRAVTTWRDEEARNEAHFRFQNEQTSQAPDSFTNTPATAAFTCECGDAGCHNQIELTRHEYERVRSHPTTFLIERDHENPELEVVISECDRFAVTDKVESEAMRIARFSDPRSAAGEGGVQP